MCCAARTAQVATYDYRKHYVEDLEHVIDMAAIAKSGLRIGADPSAARACTTGSSSHPTTASI